MRSLNTLLQRVVGTIERHRMFAPGQRLGIAVSGGVDSVCLLHLLQELAASWNLSLSVLHLDHQLRGDESKADSQFVQDLGDRLGLPVISRRATLPVAGNLEQAARRARLAFFAELIDAGAVERIALGHTRSDQAETVLFRFLRGAGTAGLAGIRPVTSTGIVRPLLDVTRAEVETFLRERGIGWREDSTNAGRRFARNRIRHELLPQLCFEWNPKIAHSLARTADWALAEEAYWQHEIDLIEPQLLRQQQDAVLLNASSASALPLATARRLVRRAIERVKGDLLGIDFRHIDGVLDLARRASGAGRMQTPGLDICRSFDWVRLAPPEEISPYSFEAAPPGIVSIPGANRALSLELIEKPETFKPNGCVYNGDMGWVDWARVSGSLEVRSWRPGDRYRPIGHSGVKTLKTLFQVARIPHWERSRWPLLVAGNSVLWTRGFGPAAEVAPGAASRTILTVRETETA
jgi:tRNA(Ile)-lysidine synthase